MTTYWLFRDHIGLFLPQFRDRRIQLAAENEDRRADVQKDQCDHRRGEARIHRDIGEGVFGEIAAEGSAADHPQHQRRHDAGRDLEHAAPPRRQPQMQDGQRDDHHHRRRGVAREGDDAAERLQSRHVADELVPDERRQHDEEGEGE